MSECFRVCPRKRNYLPILELLPPPALGERGHRGLARRAAAAKNAANFFRSSTRAAAFVLPTSRRQRDCSGPPAHSSPQAKTLPRPGTVYLQCSIQPVDEAVFLRQRQVSITLPDDSPRRLGPPLPGGHHKQDPNVSSQPALQ